MPQQTCLQVTAQSFTHQLAPRWRRYLIGNGTLQQANGTLRLITRTTTTRQYSDAQLDDYQTIPGQRFPWRAPLRLTLRARFSHPTGQLKGTAGFGFWNYPFLLPEDRPPTLPRAIWFFHASPPSDMKLDLHTPGFGWKVATIDALHPPALALAPFAPIAVPLMNLPMLYRNIWPPIQRILRIREAPIPTSMTDWHIYTIEWGKTTSRFCVDGVPVLDHAPSPQGNLCFVTWVDNQYMIVKPWGRFGWGLLATSQHQWLEIEWLAIEQQ